MKPGTYRALYRWAQPRAAVLQGVNRAITLGVYLWFGGLVLYLLWRAPAMALRVAVCCGVPFVLLTLFRRWCNAPRPYEVFGIPPVLPKETKGKSFPSRHVFSIFVIGACSGGLYPVAGLVLCLAGVLLAAVRVVTGVHFLKDVLVGAAVGLLAGGGGMLLWAAL